MEKAKLTQEQANALEAALKKESADAILKTAATDYETWFNECSPLNFVDLPTIAKALYAGYEVEETFKPGDKIIRLTGGRIFTLREKSEKFENGWYTEEFLAMIPEFEFRKPTPEEIYWLETLGRDKVGDFRIDDMYLTSKKGYFRINNDADIFDMKKWYERGDFGGIYPAESFKLFSKE